MRSDKVSVMLLGCSNAGVSEQQLHGTNISAVTKQLNCERIAETVRVSVDAGDNAQTLNSPAQAVHARHQFALAVPEKVFARNRRRNGRQGLESVRSILMKQYLERLFRLHHSQSEMASWVECVAAQLRDVANAQAGVEKRVDESASAVAEVGSVGRVSAGDLVASGEEG